MERIINNISCKQNIAKSAGSTLFPLKRLISSTDTSHFLFICIFSFLVLFSNTASAQETFQYTGYLKSDSVRKAYLTLAFSGTNVTGNLKLNKVCQSNARLPGAEFSFSGKVKGSWEGKGSAISGDWFGKVKWCGKEEKRSGQMTIAMKNGDVYFDSTGSYYNKYVFTPLGKVYKPLKSSGTSADSGSNMSSGPPSSWKRPALVPEAPLASSLGPPRKGFRSGIPTSLKGNSFGTIEMSLNETRMFLMPLNKIWNRRGNLKKHLQSFTNCFTPTYTATPGSKLSIQKKVGDGVNVKATGGGIGSVYARKDCVDCVRPDGTRGTCSLVGLWLVVIGEEGYEEYTGKKKSAKPDDTPKPDIARASIKGRAVLRNSKKPVANVRISLVTRKGGSHYRPNWKTGSNGKFSIKADNMLSSGVYEVLAVKIYTADTGKKGEFFTVDKDLWPIKKYLVTITKESTKQGSINVGDIEMDTVDNIFNKGKGRKETEKRGSIDKKISTKQKNKCGRSESPDADGNCVFDPKKDLKKARKKACTTSSECPENYSCINYSCMPDEDYDKLASRVKARGGKDKEKLDSREKSGSAGGGDSASQDDYGQSPDSEQDDDDYDRRRGYDDHRRGYDNHRRGYDDDYGEDVEDFAGDYSGYSDHLGYRDKRDRDRHTDIDRHKDRGHSTEGNGSGQINGEGDKPKGQAPKLGLNLVFKNQSTSPVHIFIHGFGEKMGPGNRVGPGGTRNLHSTLNAHKVVFVAGRNGQELSRATWVPPAGSKGASLSVVFTPSEKLEVK